MKTIILKKTLTERLTNPWEPKGNELTGKYTNQLNVFFESHNNDIETALAAIKEMVSSKENSQRSNTIFDRLILSDKTEEIILRLFKGIFEALIEEREIEIRYI